MKRGQAHLFPVYIIGAIIFMLVFVVSYTLISQVLTKESEVRSFGMSIKLQEDVNSILGRFDSVKRIEYRIPNDITEVCVIGERDMTDPRCRDEGGTACNPGEGTRIGGSGIARGFIDDLAEDGEERIVYFTKSTMRGIQHLGNIKIGQCCQFICFNNYDNRAIVTMRSVGNETLIYNEDPNDIS